jgi:REP element-mobilizing transposase RayT
MIQNQYGKIADSIWRQILDHYHHVDLDEFIIMPNHVHGIIIISELDFAGTEHCSVPAKVVIDIFR